MLALLLCMFRFVLLIYRGCMRINTTSCTGKSLSEALLFAEHEENMLCTKIVLNVRNNFCTQGVNQKLRGQDEVGGWSIKCP